MEFIQIPLPDFSFENLIKKKAQNFIKVYLNLSSFVNPYTNTVDKIKNDLNAELWEAKDLGHKLIFIVELINHIKNLRDDYNRNRQSLNFENPTTKLMHQEKEETVIDAMSNMQFYLYGVLQDCGYSLDKNTFANDEIIDLNRKINAILIKLDEIQVGNEVIFNEVEELRNTLKDEFESLKSDFPLGKKRWYQRAAGIVVSYAGTKGADEVYEQLKPLIQDFFANHAPHIIDKL